jgi:cell division protein FtsX
MTATPKLNGIMAWAVPMVIALVAAIIYIITSLDDKVSASEYQKDTKNVVNIQLDIAEMKADVKNMQKDIEDIKNSLHK